MLRIEECKHELHHQLHNVIAWRLICLDDLTHCIRELQLIEMLFLILLYRRILIRDYEHIYRLIAIDSYNGGEISIRAKFTHIKAAMHAWFEKSPSCLNRLQRYTY